ncbi:uncharacterized protein RAG0_10025 [Rhynchosporium agropyri]|uniref:Uncharacterized protein n=1 Tax=Rhynchosporium agropyri TaxID=914238 RepID=A0A1E1KY54_9HELO|nr:uncharacterized protein RAG0_10025 [Rhynchosporium agropyri]
MACLIWVFSCGHKLLQLNDQDITAEGRVSLFLRGKSQQAVNKCPECTKVDDDTMKTKDGEEGKSRDILDAYQVQADFITKQIEAAEGYQEMSAGLKKTLGACQIVWADKLGAIEKKLAMGPILKPSPTVIQHLDTALAKARLFFAADLARSEIKKAASKSFDPNVPLKKPAPKQIRLWGVAVGELEKAKLLYGKAIEAILANAEGTIQRVWSEALMDLKQ